MNTTVYAKSLVDPFDTAVSQPKLLDGKVDRSSGIRLRHTAQLDCPLNGTAKYIVISAGFASVLSWQNGDTGTAVDAQPAFTSHFGTQAERDLIYSIRVVATAAKFTLVNSPDENEGFFEAIRVPRIDLAATNPITPRPLFDAETVSGAFADAANNQSYQTGKLRDIHRYLFRLNSRGDHDFLTNMTGTGQNGVRDPSFDTIIIKITGRVDSTQPTIIRYDVISCQELEYQPGTMLARLMTYSRKLNNLDALIKKLNFRHPALKLF